MKNMKLKLNLAVLLVSLFTLTSFGQTKTETKTTTPPKDISVLFIGNSYTFMNEMPTAIFKKMVEADGKYKAHVDKSTLGGSNLAYHASNPETYEKINSYQWDYVILQGFSREFAQPIDTIDANTKKNIQQLLDSIYTNRKDTKVLLYMTWGYQDGFGEMETTDSYKKMQDLIVNNYIRVANELNVGISPVGLAWKNIRATEPEINLYHTDGAHPSLTGSYLIASVFYKRILNKNPEGNNNTIKVDPAVKLILEKVANNTVDHLQALLNPKKINLDNSPNLKTGFDVVVKSKTVDIFDRSEGADMVYYKIDYDDKNLLESRDLTLKRKKGAKRIVVTQVVWKGQKFEKTTRIINFD